MKWRRRRKGGCYNLSHVKKLVRRKRFFITSKALYSANGDFGWGPADIQDAICKLKPKNFFKTAPAKYMPGVMVDYYKARKLKGEKVYLHFYIDYEDSQEWVILHSCKRLEE